ncbi:hypothetical protein BRYFOR_05734 [Marvinbryantia formatexigens DSM 14469]|uniref:Uncharacterized protein n=2 Tax=Marvinbryantia TaxID=248744 RepID=C6LAU0_9FIRM|nr:hypothetical protein BRYFOR_05734 [Marvinbryantia formatexigens DSM 14469]
METIRICKDRNVLVEYLRGREKEVINIMMTLFEQEYAVERYGDEREATGEMKKARETAFELADMGLPVEKIAKAVKVNLETVKGWLSGTPSAAR